MRKTVLACVVVALVAGATTATAATLITSKQIKNGTIRSADIKKGTIRGSRLKKGTINASRLSPGLQRLLKSINAQGGGGTPVGTPGGKGDKGDRGEDSITRVQSLSDNPDAPSG